jgi:hypothetical protein
MTDFLVRTLSPERWETYAALSAERGESAASLYAKNLTYSKELYVIIAGLEVSVRNSLHMSLSNHFGKRDWMSNLELLRKSHKDQINKAIEKLVQNKTKGYRIPDLISELNFGFWAHLVDAPYEQSLWTPALRHCFKNKLGRPVRQDVEERLKTLLRFRNKIAHLEPIIRYEGQLIQTYQNAYDVMSWICPETANWFDKQSNFKEVWKNNQAFRESRKDKK